MSAPPQTTHQNKARSLSDVVWVQVRVPAFANHLPCAPALDEARAKDRLDCKSTAAPF